MASTTLPILLTVNDPIPFVDAEGSCDGSVSSVGTGSILGHSSSEEDLSNNTPANAGLPWKFRQFNESQGSVDHESLNNMLDTVSSETHLPDLDYVSGDESLLKTEEFASEEATEYETLDSAVNYQSIDTIDNGKKLVRPTSLKFSTDSLKKCRGITTLMSAYSALSDQVTKILLLYPSANFQRKLCTSLLVLVVYDIYSTQSSFSNFTIS